MQSDVKREWFDTDYYKVLGVDAKASDKEITKQYRRLARKYHPDANSGDAKAEERFKEVSAAYDVIGDAEKRKQYDQVRTMGPFSQGFGGGSSPFGATGNMGDISDLLGAFFGGAQGGGRSNPFQNASGSTRQGPGFNQRPQQPGKDQKASITISFEEALRGTTTTLTVSDSKGSRKVNARIPALVSNNQKIRLPKKGGPGNPPGDLYVTVKVEPHPLFSIEKGRVQLDVPISFSEAALGATVKIPSYSGSTVSVRVPAGAKHGTKMRVKGAGPDLGDGESDLVVCLQLDTPKQLSAEQIDLFENLKSLENNRDTIRSKFKSNS